GAIDPVCGMAVDPASSAGSSDFNNKTYHFCSPVCVAKFEADPEKYIAAGLKPGEHKFEPMSAAPSAAVEYTCPMDPEVRRSGRGTCPICGMALEPATFNLATVEENPELRDMRRRFSVSLAPAAALLAIMFSGWHAPWIELLLASPVVFWAGWPLLERG